MFYYLKGELAYRENGMCVIDCGGVGYKLTVSMNTSDMLLSKLGKEVKLFTHLAVREDGVELFGFGTIEERDCFNSLIAVSGIGPKAATSILSTLTPEKLAIAIESEDIKAISKSQGIGTKTAARVVLELKGKLPDSLSSISTPSAARAGEVIAKRGGAFQDASEALISLGYDKSSVLDALKNINPDNRDASEIIRLALKNLMR
ncbi:MAG: Holliday junction branch migration protein RuvA [Clostridia bacterium]|nr:Holliday junction branch migration protein RuvA [Clostridia bacterium]